jgi:hypothetical protein
MGIPQNPAQNPWAIAGGSIRMQQAAAAILFLIY